MGRLLAEKRFLHYDAGKERFCDDAVDRDLVAAFFQRARGLAIRGYRTVNSLVMDV